MKARLLEPMLCLAVTELPQGPDWAYEVKLDGYRAMGLRSGRREGLWSRNHRDFAARFPSVVRALGALPDETLIDGEVVALDGEGRPSFNLLQNFDSPAPAILYYAFDLPFLDGRDLRAEPLDTRRALLGELSARMRDPLRFSETFAAAPGDLIAAVRENGFEGVVAKRRDSAYLAGKRSGEWVKMRANVAQELVIGGYVPSAASFDSILVGYYEGRDLLYAGRIRSGFVPASRRRLIASLSAIGTARCPFVNLPDEDRGRWGEGLTAEKMAKCAWVKPRLVASIEFLQWTAEARLRHPRFVALREDKDPREVTRESG